MLIFSVGTSTWDLTENGHPPESDPCGSSTGRAQGPVLESAVSSASVTSSPPPPLLVDNCSTSPGFIQGEPAVESCGSEWEADEELPDLIFVDASVPAPAPETATILGRRIISPAHFIQAIRDLDRHDCSSSVAGKFVYKSERQVGLWSEFKFSCDECHQVKTVTTDPIVEPTPLKDKSELGVNDSAVWAFTSIGSGYANLDEVLSVLEIPSMSKGAYCRREESLGKVTAMILITTISNKQGSTTRGRPQEISNRPLHFMKSFSIELRFTLLQNRTTIGSIEIIGSSG